MAEKIKPFLPCYNSHQKTWGSEQWIVNKDYCGKSLLLRKGYRCSLHYHKNKDETFYVTKGKVLMEVDDEEFVMVPGQAIRITPNTLHRFTGLKYSLIIEFSTHHEESDSYRKEASCKMTKKEFKKLEEKYS